MPAPAHEQLPPNKGGGKVAVKAASTVERVADIVSLLFEQNMTPIQIYRWNKAANPVDPDHLDKWDKPLEEVMRLIKAARKQGSTLLAKDPDEAARMALMGYAGIKRRALKAGHFTVAFHCEKEMAAIRGTRIRKGAAMEEIQDNPSRPAHAWVDGEVIQEFDGAGIS